MKLPSIPKIPLNPRLFTGVGVAWQVWTASKIDAGETEDKIFECLGYKTEVTKATGDCGKDIVMWKKDENNIKKKYVVEVKRYTDKKVSRGELQKLHSAMMTNGADGAFFVTTSEFSSKAIEHAPLCNIKLINKQKLKEMIAEVMLNENTDLDSLNEITSIFKHREII